MHTNLPKDSRHLKTTRAALIHRKYLRLRPQRHCSLPVSYPMHHARHWAMQGHNFIRISIPQHAPVLANIRVIQPRECPPAPRRCNRIRETKEQKRERRTTKLVFNFTYFTDEGRRGTARVKLHYGEEKDYTIARHGSQVLLFKRDSRSCKYRKKQTRWKCIRLFSSSGLQLKKKKKKWMHLNPT